MMISEWIPPVAKKAIRKIKPAFKKYHSLQAAESAVSPDGHYNHEVITDIVLAKTHEYIKALTSHGIQSVDPCQLFLLSTIGLLSAKQKLKVLDLGGAFGAHYFVAKHHFPDMTFDWTVLELPKVVQKGKVLENSELSFFDTNGDLGSKLGDYDVVLTSGTLQHMPDPDVALQFLLMQEATHVLFLRLGFNPLDQHYWIIHRARYQDCGPAFVVPGYPDGVIELPFCLFSEQKFENALAQDYKLQLETIEHSGVKWVDQSVSGYNRLYQRK